MGGALLQKVNRDTLSFATKLCCRIDKENQTHLIAKTPKTDKDKISLPGQFHVILDPVSKLPTVLPKNNDHPTVSPEDDLLRVVYDRKPVPNVFDDFITLRNRLQSQWTSFPLEHNPISQELQILIDAFRAQHQ